MAVISSKAGKIITKAPAKSFFSTKITGSAFDPTEGADVETTSTNTGGSTSGAYTYAAALEKIKADQAAATAAVTRATTGAQNQANYLTGMLNQGIPKNVLDLIGQSETTGKDYITNQYKTLTDQLRGSYAPETNVGTGYLGAQGRTTAGYNALQNYLQQNQPRAFQQAPQTPATSVTNDLAQYMGGQGVSTAPVDPTINALNAAAGGGAQNFNSLLATLGQLQQSNQESRMAEQQMGRSGALSGLEQVYQGQTGGLQQQQLQALAELQSNIFGQRLTAEQQAAARNQAIQDALAALLGGGYINPGQINPTTITGTAPGTVITETKPTVNLPAPVVTPKTPIEQLAAIPVKASNTALINKIESFVTANPNATLAQIKKKFPDLSKNITGGTTTRSSGSGQQLELE
jgi:hypothetical protein